jgi:Fe-S-cluster containining protein
MPLLQPPFDRTSCACESCTEFCTKSPGHLIPADLFRITDRLIADRLITEPRDVLTYLQASAGAVVGDAQTGKLYRIGTIVPKRQEDGRCIFLTEDNRCAIHSVSPFGCAFFDSHMNQIEGSARSMWGLRQISGTPAYEEARQVLIKRDGGQYEPFPSPLTPTEEAP